MMIRSGKLFPVLLSLICVFAQASSQNTGHRSDRTVFVQGIDDTEIRRLAAKTLENAQDSAGLLRLTAPVIQLLQEKGFAEAEIESFFFSTDTLAVNFKSGPRYIFGQINLHGLNSLYQEKVGIRHLEEKQLPVNWQDLENRLLDCAKIYQNEGYPFAAFKDLHLTYSATGDTIYTDVEYRFDAGPLVRIDSIRINGKPRENARFLYSLIRISPNSPYNQSQIDDIPRILNNSIYYQKVGNPEVIFTPFHTARLNISLEKKQAGRFDILLGILPPANNTQKLSFTGTMDIVLVSPFRQGELVSFKYNKLTSTSQQMETKLMVPYLFGTPLKVEASLDLLKQEEDFLNLSYQGSLFYELSPFLSARFYFQGRNSRLLDAAIADTVKGNPAQLDGTRETVGAGLVYEKLDYRFNPAKGLSAAFDIGLGRRIIRENILLIRKNPETYQGLDLRQPSREINLRLKWYYSFFPRHVIHLGNHTYWLGMETYLRNDQLQVGGSRSIRGFNENQFFTDFYSFFTAEYRFQLERDSYMFIFGDYAYLENHEAGLVQHPAGFGLGMNYGTKAGIISITYAVGGVEGAAFQPARGKIHIGMVNQF
ncbi:MAG: hypothetical protein SF052_17450 [Bacteroidia bacterium]|nr:hypothetical protein [Bacteroidia bacterium]